MAAAPSMGVLARLGTADDTSATPTAATTEYEWKTESLGLKREIISTNGIRGTRVRTVERVRQGRSAPGGTVTMEPTYADMVLLWPKIFAAVSTGTFTPSDTVPVAFQLQANRVAKLFTWTGCRTSKATLKAVSGGPLELSWDVEALTETVAAASWGAIAPSATPPYVFTDGVLNLAGGPIQVADFEMTIDWHLNTARFMNSLTRTDLPSMDLEITLKVSVPYTSDTVALYDGGGTVAGVAATMTFTYLGTSQLFTFANIVFPATDSPTVGGKDEILLVLHGEARKSGATPPLVITSDFTP